MESKLSFKDSVWTSIEEMPIWNWNKITEENDLTFLYKGSGKFTDRLEPIWDDLQEQHIAEFGYSEAMKSRERLMLKIIRHNLNYLKTKQRYILNFIKIGLLQLEEKDKVAGIKFGKLLMILSKQMGFRINTKEFTVYEWYHSLNTLSDGSS